MDWIKSIIEKYIGEDGKLDLEATLKEINKKAPENVVPKEQYNSLAETKKKLDEDVKTRDKQLAELQKAGVLGHCCGGCRLWGGDGVLCNESEAGLHPRAAHSSGANY